MAGMAPPTTDALTCARLAGMPTVHEVSGSAMTVDALDSYLAQHEMQAGALYVPAPH